MKKYEIFARALKDGASLFAACYLADINLRSCRRLKRFYVYVLADPRNDEIFYVGKGSNNRAFEHLAEWKSGLFLNVAKCKRIGEIVQSGNELSIWCLIDDLEEHHAFSIERTLIQNVPKLTNIHRGTAEPAQEKIGIFAEKMLNEITPFHQWRRYVLPTLKGDSDHIKDYWWLVAMLSEAIQLGKKATLETA